MVQRSASSMIRLAEQAITRASASNPSSVRRLASAIRFFATSRANWITEWKEPAFLDTLAAAYAELGRWPAAIEFQDRAIALALSGAGEGDDLDRLRAHLALFRGQEPVRE